MPDHLVENLRTALGSDLDDHDIRRIAEHYSRFSHHGYLAGVLPHLRGFKREKHWKAEGLQYLEKALKEGHGAILATGHFGHGRLVGPIARAHGFDVKRVVAKTADDVQRRDRWLSWLGSNRSLPRQLLRGVLWELLRPHDISASLDVRPILAALGANKPVMIAGDGLKGTEFVMLSLLGHEYPYPTGLMKLAMKTGAPVLPAFAVEANGGRQIVLKIHPPLDIKQDREVRANVQAFAEVFDSEVRKSPHQWTRWEIPNVFQAVRTWTEAGLAGHTERSFTKWATSGEWE